MAKKADKLTATSRIKTYEGTGDERRATYIQVGDEVSEDLARQHPHAVSQAPIETMLNGDDNEALADYEAAVSSIQLRPDNPNRPESMPGESWKSDLRDSRPSATTSARAGMSFPRMGGGAGGTDPGLAAGHPTLLGLSPDSDQGKQQAEEAEGARQELRDEADKAQDAREKAEGVDEVGEARARDAQRRATENAGVPPGPARNAGPKAK